MIYRSAIGIFPALELVGDQEDTEFSDSNISATQRAAGKELVEFIAARTNSHILFYLACAFDHAAQLRREQERRVG